MGGAEVFTREIATRWVKKGHELTLFSSEFRGCKKTEVADGVTIIRSGGRLSVYEQARKVYSKLLSKQGFDVIIDEINTVPFFAPRFASGEKVIALIHQHAREYWFYETPFPINYIGFNYLENRWLKQYVNVPTVTVSASSAKDLKEIGFRNIYIVPEGLGFTPLQTLPKKEMNPIIVFAGRLKRTKRPDHAIRAFALVKERLPDAQLWIIGDGPFRQKLERMGGKGITFFGSIDNSARRDLIKQSSVLINPGVREGWGLNVIEANALGVPAIGYDVHGLRDSIKDNETGLLAKTNVEDLAAKIITLLNNQMLLERLRRNALDYSRAFSWDKTADKFLSFILGII